MAEIKNRRENIRINEYPVEIPSVEQINEIAEDVAEDIVEDVTDGKLVPSGGTNGQVLTKKASGFGWEDAGGGGVEAVNFYTQYEDAIGDSTKLGQLVEDVCTAIDAGKIAYIQYTGSDTLDENVTISGSTPIIKSADLTGASPSMNMKEIKFIMPKIREASVMYLIRIFSSNGSGTLFKYEFELTEVTE